MTGRSVAVGLLALVIAACTSVRSPTPGQPHLGLSNATTMRVSLVVNGVGAGAYPPGASVGLKPAELPPLPWHVEVRTGEGRVLASIDVPADDPYMTAQPEGETTAGAIVSLGRSFLRFAGRVGRERRAAARSRATSDGCARRLRSVAMSSEARQASAHSCLESRPRNQRWPTYSASGGRRGPCRGVMNA